MNAIDLFAGVGGLSLGFSQEAFNIVYANEYDPMIASSYKLNHPDTEVNTEDIGVMNLHKNFRPYAGKVDIVMGGPPCQGFSQKGRRIGLGDRRNFLFRQFVEVVRIVQPQFVLLENVPNILSLQNGYFKKEIMNMFSDLGYDMTADVLKAENFGVPQQRRRAVFLGQKNKLQVTLLKDNGIRTTVKNAIDDLPKLVSGQGQEFVGYQSPPRSSYQKLMRNESKGLWNHIATKHSRTALERLSYIKLYDTKNALPPEHRTKSIHSGTWTRIDPNGYSRTITTRFDTPSSGQFTLADQDRCITVREAARIQSFPDNFIFRGTKSSQMTQVGNAVPPLLARSVAVSIRSFYLNSGVVSNKVKRGKKHIPIFA